MITFFSPRHELHAPAYEFFRGERVPCFESPARANFVLDELVARGHEVRAPVVDSLALLQQVHTPRYLAFLESAWRQWLALDAANETRQPFPSVWPVRSLRSDVEPFNFTARMGLYSMDNGSPLAAGTPHSSCTPVAALLRPNLMPLPEHRDEANLRRVPERHGPP